jgi:hypothetical protein
MFITNQSINMLYRFQIKGKTSKLLMNNNVISFRNVRTLDILERQKDHLVRCKKRQDYSVASQLF